MTKKAYQRGQIRDCQQDGNREFISLLACVCADGTTTPPALIYQGASNDLQSTWVDDVEEGDKAYFTSSTNGWTCNALGLAWLRRFHQDTVKKGQNRRRLLILDGHSSHINWAFVTLADSLRILILILPPHSTHRLQPLDVGLFDPLQQAYCKALDEFSFDGLGWVSMTKRMFWSVFKIAWEKSFTEKNIKSAFKKTGIFPLKKEITISQLPELVPATPPTSRLIPLLIPTPMTSRAIRQLVKATPSRAKINLLERAVMRLVTENDIKSHENRGLRKAIVKEKTRRKRGGRLNLMGEVAGQDPQFFSPQKVLAAKAYQEGKETREQEEKHQKALKKEEAIHRRQQIVSEKLEARLQRQMQQEIRRETVAAEKAEKKAQREALQAQKAQQKKEIAAATALRKKEAAFQQQAVTATQKATTSKEGKKQASKVVPSKGKRAVKPAAKAVKSKAATQIKSSHWKSPHSMPAAASTLAAAPRVGLSSRSGRNVIRPQRFE